MKLAQIQMNKPKKTSREIQNESEILFKTFCKAFNMPEPIMEHRFLLSRRFRFDYAFMEYRIAVEVEGGVWIQGRHTRGIGFIKDMEKYNLATAEGWKILRFTPQQLRKEETYLLIKKCMENCK